MARICLLVLFAVIVVIALATANPISQYRSLGGYGDYDGGYGQGGYGGGEYEDFGGNVGYGGGYDGEYGGGSHYR